MSKVRQICNIATWKILLTLLGVIVASSLITVFLTAPKVEKLLLAMAENYDSYLPEIKIRDGHASVREKQPYVVDMDDKEVAVVIDTRDGMQKSAMDHLKEASAGAVLTRDTLIMKNRGEVRIFSLKEMPDMEINSGTLQDLVSRYWPLAMRLGAVVVVLYFFIVKPFQILMFGLLPYFGARLYNAPLTYGESLKIAAIGIIPPVLLDILISVTELVIPGGTIVYFAVYAGVLLLACAELVRGLPRVFEDHRPNLNS